MNWMIRNLHWMSVGANGAGIVICLFALSRDLGNAHFLTALAGWMLLNGAVSTNALRGKG